jgi:hypothetical protein
MGEPWLSEKKWRLLGKLQLPRAGFPSVLSFGGKLFVMGGKVEPRTGGLQEKD